MRLAQNPGVAARVGAEAGSGEKPPHAALGAASAPPLIVDDSDVIRPRAARRNYQAELKRAASQVSGAPKKIWPVAAPIADLGKSKSWNPNPSARHGWPHR